VNGDLYGAALMGALAVGLLLWGFWVHFGCLDRARRNRALRAARRSG